MYRNSEIFWATNLPLGWLGDVERMLHLECMNTTETTKEHLTRLLKILIPEHGLIFHLFAMASLQQSHQWQPHSWDLRWVEQIERWKALAPDQRDLRATWGISKA